MAELTCGLKNLASGRLNLRVTFLMTKTVKHSTECPWREVTVETQPQNYSASTKPRISKIKTEGEREKTEEDKEEKMYSEEFALSSIPHPNVPHPLESQKKGVGKGREEGEGAGEHLHHLLFSA